MVQLYCSEQIAIPETFPNILKTYAKAAIRTQPYDILRWSAAYFRSLADKAPPPVKIRLERECRQGALTKGYLRVLIAQVGKGFFISRCLLQEKWKALCLPEDELLKYLSLCRMLNWPQVHWLKVVAVLAASLCPSPQQSMAMICELLSDDAEGGMARMPYWMFKICYNFISELDCTQELCFVNGRLVLPWGDLEEPKPMDRLPRVLSVSLLNDTIIKACKAKFGILENSQDVSRCPGSPTSTDGTDFMINAELGDPKELLAKCEDFDTIMLLLTNGDEGQVEEASKGPHFISETQIRGAQEVEDKVRRHRHKQFDKTAETARELLDEEAVQMLQEVGPPWTWLHQFTATNYNTASYNFLDLESIQSDVSPDLTSMTSFDFAKAEEPEKTDKFEEKTASLQSLTSLMDSAAQANKFDIENTSSVVSYLASDELGELYSAGEGHKAPIDLHRVARIVEQAGARGMKFTCPDHLMKYVKSVYLGSRVNVPPTTPQDSSADVGYPGDKVGGPIAVPPEWQETIPKQVEVPPRARSEEEPSDVATKISEAPKDEITKIFETTVGIPPEQAAKMPKFCFETKDADEQILGLVPVEEQEEEAEEEDLGSPISESGPQSLKGYRSDDSDIFPSDVSPPRPAAPSQNHVYRCCINSLPLSSPSVTTGVPPAPEFRCTVGPLPGIGPTVSEEVSEKFLAFLRDRARTQQGLIHPRNFTEEACPYMVDTVAL